jgi:cation diffusion facilitator CzcD-associated flavoprotein CzcO
MANFVDSDGTCPMAGVYSLQAAQQQPQQPQQHAKKDTFWRYANHIAKQSKADDYLVPEAAVRLEPDTAFTPTRWRITTTSGNIIRARAVILATGLVPHYQAPKTWLWWEHLPAHNKALALQSPQQSSQQSPQQSSQQSSQKLSTQSLMPILNRERLAGKRVVVVGSSNLTAWETAVSAAQLGAQVTMLVRAQRPTVQTLPCDATWFTETCVRHFSQTPQAQRLRQLNCYRPTSIMPITLQDACERHIKVHVGAKVRSAVKDGRGVQILYGWSGYTLDTENSHPEQVITKQVTRSGEHSVYANIMIAATGPTLRLKDNPLVNEVARAYRAPIFTQGMQKHLPILRQEPLGAWKNLPPFFPMGAYARGTAGLAANSMASATVYLPLVLEQLLAQNHL